MQLVILNILYFFQRCDNILCNFIWCTCLADCKKCNKKASRNEHSTHCVRHTKQIYAVGLKQKVDVCIRARFLCQELLKFSKFLQIYDINNTNKYLPLASHIIEMCHHKGKIFILKRPSNVWAMHSWISLFYIQCPSCSSWISCDSVSVYMLPLFVFLINY